MSKITIDVLAGMMNKSFEHLEQKLGKKIEDVRDELSDRFDKLENNHERRVTILEDDVRVLKTTVNKN